MKSYKTPLIKISKLSLLLSLIFLFLLTFQIVSSSTITETTEVKKVENISDDTYAICLATISLQDEKKVSNFIHKSHIYTFTYKKSPFKPPISNLL